MPKERVSCFTITGLIFVGVSICFIIFSSAYPYWWESRPERDTGVPNIGLWEICFAEKGYTAPIHDEFMKKYSGCNYVFDRELETIVHWIFPDWYIVVVTFVTTGLLTLPVCLILVIVYMMRVCSPHSEHILIGLSCLLTLFQGFLSMISVILFGIKSSRDGDWMPQPASNFLSYSYGVAAFIPVFCFIAATCFAIDYLRLYTQRLLNARARVYAKGEFNHRY